MLDASVAKLRASSREGATSSGVGSPLQLRELEPYASPVNGAILLDRLVRLVRRYVVLPLEDARTVALWIVHAHAVDAADITPRLCITSPQKRCGKTRLIEIIGQTTPLALAASNISKAAVFRAIEAAHPTLLIDEADTFLTDNEELRGILNSGHSRGTAYVIRLWAIVTKPANSLPGLQLRSR